MSDTDSIEVTAATIDEAIKQALEKMGAGEDDVAIEILSSPRSGVLGLGARPAKVRVRRRQPSAASSAGGSPSSPGYDSDPAVPSGEPGGLAAAARSAASMAAGAGPSPVPHAFGAEQRLQGANQAGSDQIAANEGDDDRGNRIGGALLDRSDSGADRKSAAVAEQAREAIESLSVLLSKMSEQAEVRLAASDDEGIELEVKGDGSGILIGRHGQTLDALEYLINRILARRIKDPVSVTIDTEAYRARRNQQLERMALSMGERAKREHQKMTLEPMPPRDRRIIHLALKDDPLLVTRSTGAGYLRTVEIAPTQEGREAQPRERTERGRGRGRGGRGRDQDRERGRGSISQQSQSNPAEGPIGESGGFKHGQKRM
jgi:spoIIIJ-associated protein